VAAWNPWRSLRQLVDIGDNVNPAYAVAALLRKRASRRTKLRAKIALHK